MANINSEVLDKYLVQVRRIAESREEGAEKEIRRLYKALIKDLNGFLGNEYIKYSDEDERLTYGILQVKGECARFLEEVNKKVEGILPEVKTAVDELINDTYEKCYNGMVEGVKKSATAEALQNEFKAVKAVRPEVIKAAVQNPIPKLRLTPTLERCRKNVISNIKREIGVGLSQGDRISTMAKRINNRVDISYRQSMLIARTEAHRVRETGLNDAANEVDEILKANGSEYRKIKIWNTCEDSSVRDTHAKMNVVAVLQDEKFELPSGATAECPGTSGVASEDCNCRCFLTHDIVTDAEFYELTGRHFPDYTVDKSGKSSIINYAKGNPYIVNEDDIPSTAKILPNDINDELSASPIGKETFNYIKDNNVAVYLNYQSQSHSYRGEEQGGVINIYMDNIQSARVAAQTVIHEVTHQRYNIGSCQWAEAVCMAQEKKHLVQRDTLTFAEKRSIVKLAQQAYPEYNWKKGGYKNGKYF